MNLKNATLSLLLAASGIASAQEASQPAASNPTVEQKLSYLDSIKATFVQDNIASCVDSLWMKELTSTDIYAELASDIASIDVDKKVDYELSTELLKARLKEMDAKSPFNIEYNPGLENIIKSFLKNRKKSFERLMAVSEYYFPMFEEALAKKNVPLEIKYLAVVESALNPKAVSRVGATGLWQFMYQTGKQYNLHIDSYVDERSDPLKASEAAAQYMTNMYRIFGDWDLVLAAYNSGPGNVAKAIRRSNGQQNYWNIRKNLPKETQGYVPAFLATMYIYEYHKEHGIVPNRALVKHFETDTIMVKQQMSFKQISDLLDVPVSQLQLLNPSYKMNTVPHYADKAHYLRLPADKIAMFTSNEEKIYAYVTHELNKRERPYTPSYRQQAIASADSTADHNVQSKVVTKTKYYKVRRGDSFGAISNKYGISVASIKRANGIKGNVLHPGQNLKLITSERIYQTEKAKVKTPVETVVASADTTQKAEKSQYYTVQAGDNLTAIAKKYNVSVDDLREWNNLADNSIQLDSKIKVAQIISHEDADSNEAEQEPQFKTQEYVVAKGDNLGSIAKRFGISLNEIKSWNGISDTTILVGKKLVVGKKEVAEEAVAEHKPSKAAVAKKNQEHYYVRKGDSLFSIAKKYPGVTISDIKKWNGIRGNSLKPGMKLKING
ncbi:MAG TPA: LysM peptidoglycan-binding domain-containing protein [Flavobacterium sp.]|jgi:membrane-bound lytic murein transglycosylase D